MTAPALTAASTVTGLASQAASPFAEERPRVQAWALAIALHAAAIAVVLIAFERAEPPEPPALVRLVFVEPPPPPPPLLGAPGGVGTAPALPAEPVPQALQPPRPEPKPRAEAPIRPRPQRPAAAPKPAAQSPAAQPPAAEVQAGTAVGTPDGMAAGGTGGVSGGVVGGLVGGRGSGPVPAGQVAHPPTVISRVTPQYPRHARLAGVEGLVVLEAILDARGQIAPEVKVLRSVRGLDDAALEALRKWRFKPARDERGHEVAVILEVPIRFVLR